MTAGKLPTFFISHGGGPWPWMPEQMDGPYRHLAEALRQMPQQVGAKPNAVLMVSAHWEEPAFTVMANATPPMVYDYGGSSSHVPHPIPSAWLASAGATLGLEMWCLPTL